MTSIYESKPWLAQYDEAMRAWRIPEASTVLDVFRAAVDQVPDRTALAYFDGRLSYREVDRLSDGIAAYLTSRGFGRGDRLAIVLQNVPQFVLALLGAWKAGGIVVPVNPMYREHELAHVLADSGAVALVCSERSWRETASALVDASAVHTVLTTSELDLQTRHDARVLGTVERCRDEKVPDLLEVARRQVTPVADPGLSGDDIALISYTSGTSGVPKGATNTQANLAVNAAGMGTASGIPEHGTIFALAPLFHITGMVCQLVTAMHLGGTMALAYRFEPGVVLDALLEHRPAYMVGPSTAYMALMARPETTRDHFASFALLYSGGAPLPPAVVADFRERFGHYIRNGYGLTESSAGCVVVPATAEAPIDAATGTLSIGLPTPGTTVWILGEQGEELPFGQPGEIAVRGPMVVPGYWNKPQETAAALPGGRLLTGDIGFMDADGWVYVVDRKKDMINASGFKVWPREVEDVLYTHPAVREAAVVGVPDAYRGETVKAYVSLRPGFAPDPQELVAYCKERVAAYKYPREIEVLAELPKTVSGKILRRELRAQN